MVCVVCSLRFSMSVVAWMRVKAVCDLKWIFSEWILDSKSWILDSNTQCSEYHQLKNSEIPMGETLL